MALRLVQFRRQKAATAIRYAVKRTGVGRVFLVFAVFMAVVLNLIIQRYPPPDRRF
jgi:hypothetical protein